MEKSKFNCHICNQPFTLVPSKSGVMLRCDTAAPECLPHENVYGHGSTEKEAAEIAKQKYRPS
jgi:hypothetical protein